MIQLATVSWLLVILALSSKLEAIELSPPFLFQCNISSPKFSPSGNYISIHEMQDTQNLGRSNVIPGLKLLNTNTLQTEFKSLTSVKAHFWTKGADGEDLLIIQNIFNTVSVHTQKDKFAYFSKHLKNNMSYFKKTSSASLVPFVNGATHSKPVPSLKIRGESYAKLDDVSISDGLGAAIIQLANKNDLSFKQLIYDNQGNLKLVLLSAHNSKRLVLAGALREGTKEPKIFYENSKFATPFLDFEVLKFIENSERDFDIFVRTNIWSNEFQVRKLSVRNDKIVDNSVVFHKSGFDLEAPFIFDSNRLVGAHTNSGTKHFVSTSSTLELEKLYDTLPTRKNDNFIVHDVFQNLALIEISNKNGARFYRVNIDNNGFVELPIICNDSKSSVLPIYVKEDGQLIPNYYVTNNNSKTNDKSLVIFLHGGPFERIANKTDIFESALIDSGYSVLQVNYPGSAGFGKKFAMAYPLNPNYYERVSSFTKKVLERLREENGSNYKRVHLWGQSFGGHLVTKFVIDFPHTLKGVSNAVSTSGPYDFCDYVREGRNFHYLHDWEGCTPLRLDAEKTANNVFEGRFIWLFGERDWVTPPFMAEKFASKYEYDFEVLINQGHILDKDEIIKVIARFKN